MMIGAEKGSQDSTSAVGLDGFTSTVCRKSIGATRSMITGVAACCASCSLFTIAPTAAKSDE